MGSTCIHTDAHTKFHPNRTLLSGQGLPFSLSTNQKKYANELINMHIYRNQFAWVVLLYIPMHIPSFIIIFHDFPGLENGKFP